VLAKCSRAHATGTDPVTLPEQVPLGAGNVLDNLQFINSALIDSPLLASLGAVRHWGTSALAEIVSWRPWP
jgi:hypothetical protein